MTSLQVLSGAGTLPGSAWCGREVADPCGAHSLCLMEHLSYPTWLGSYIEQVPPSEAHLLCLLDQVEVLCLQEIRIREGNLAVAVPSLTHAAVFESFEGEQHAQILCLSPPVMQGSIDS